MSVELVDFVVGNGYYKCDEYRKVMPLLKDYFRYSNFSPYLINNSTDSLYMSSRVDKGVTELVWESSQDKCCDMDMIRNFLQNIFKQVADGSSKLSAMDYHTKYAIFVETFEVFHSEYTVTIMKLIPREVRTEVVGIDSIKAILVCDTYHIENNSSYQTDNVVNARIVSSAYYILKRDMKLDDVRLREIQGMDSSLFFDDSALRSFNMMSNKELSSVRNMSDDINIPDHRITVPVNTPYIHDTIPCMGTRNFLCNLPTPIELKANAKAFGEMVGSLKALYEYDLLKACKKVFSIELENDLLTGGSNMNILDQLPKIKRLERNGAFTTAVWEDGTVTKLKKSDQDEDDFEKLVFFLILKKLCDNNTHKMHSTLTDYLNTFRDATVDIPKQKEEKAEKKRKAKEGAEGATKVILDEEWKENDERSGKE